MKRTPTARLAATLAAGSLVLFGAACDEGEVEEGIEDVEQGVEEGVEDVGDGE